MSVFHKKLSRRKWAQARQATLNRDRFRCRDCGKAGRLAVHHLVPLKDGGGGDPYAIDGLLTVCVGCHKKRHRKSDPERGQFRALALHLLKELEKHG